MDLDDLEHTSLIGSGYFCIVKSMIHKESGSNFALKELKGRFYSNDEYRYRLLREIDLLKELSECPNIVEIYAEGNDHKNEKLWYLMEKGDYNLHNYIRTNNQNLSLEDRFNIADQILDAIKCAHDKSILHRDIAPNNVLAFEKDSEIIVKLCDFGLGKNEESISHYTGSSQNHYGQIMYVSPEQRDKLKDATFKSDIYSLGKLIYFVFTAKDPIDIQAFELISLVRNCISEDPSERFKDLEEFNDHYLRLKELAFEDKIPSEYMTLNDLLGLEEDVDWMRFHEMAVEGKYQNHVYHDYLYPIMDILLLGDNKINEYYSIVGNDITEFISTFIDRIDDCLGTVGWPFSSTSVFGKLLKQLYLTVNDDEAKLKCLDKLWSLAYYSDQWDVQADVKQIVNKHGIPKNLEIPFSEIVSKYKLNTSLSYFDELKLPKIVKASLAKKYQGKFKLKFCSCISIPYT